MRFGRPALAPAHERLTRWSPEVFAAIEWRRFEAVCEALFAQAGFETRAQSHGPDGGVDIWLHSCGKWGQITISTRLLELARRTPEQQTALLAVAFEGDYGRPPARAAA